ncbi:NAD(P)-dependent dehydrogenase, short-chain alcohol dehydrogenase family [Streptosporangium subroseum]|uniref:NAD(P)-dependent dehydrogenase, short-chain alcohol dehydrogenase family n=1 Tax=Streptosporangium subroseum TaxID=106412 RepID=A0A239IXA2_9ACTN|nr:SDR family oxidoreductase [Streptosporangium subroseum]SNS98145.1 NAD(P)-dependent dehydrogenase, short-chain alcohol dehydrogenase family [Streptosporangium subroseum]
MEFANQIVLITGGTAGIGLEAARLFAREGAQVIITGRDTERGKKAVDAINDTGRVRFVQADLADLDSVSSLVEQSGPVDVVVNNAGAFPVALTVEQDIAGFQTIFDTNVRGAYFLVAKLVPHMLERGRGNIVNVTTMATSKGIPGASVYSASKSALASFTRTWAAEFGPHIRVNTVAPGPTRTDGVLVEWGESIEDLARTLPLGRTARAHEIAEAILFVASPRASYLTGATINVDAGATAV